MKRDVLSRSRIISYQKQLHEERRVKIQELKSMLKQTEKIKRQMFLAKLVAWPIPSLFRRVCTVSRDAKEANELIKSMLMVLQG